MIANIPSPAQLGLNRFEHSSYPARHRKGVLAALRRRARRWARELLVTLNRSTRALAGHLANLRATRAQTARLIRLPLAKPAPITTRAAASLRALSVTLRALRTSARESAPDRSQTRPRGAHRLENLTRLDNRTYLLAMKTRAAHVEAVLTQLTSLAHARAFGETTWKEARRADRAERFAPA